MIRFFMLVSFLSAVGIASTDVCVRNYNIGGVNPCETYPSLYGYAIATDPEMVFALCARKRPGQCESGEPFRWVEGQDGDRFCVIDYNQKVTGNFCEAEQLKTYHYAKAAD